MVSLQFPVSALLMPQAGKQPGMDGARDSSGGVLMVTGALD